MLLWPGTPILARRTEIWTFFGNFLKKRELSAPIRRLQYSDTLSIKNVRGKGSKP
jgi:hypothetical protein